MQAKSRRVVTAVVTALLSTILATSASPADATGPSVIVHPVSSVATCARASWVASWALPNKNAGPSYEDQTIRVLLRPSIGGRKVRVHLSNAVGDRDLRIEHASIAISDGGADVRPGSLRALSFDQAPDVTIPQGSQVLSDTEVMVLRRTDRLLVSVYARRATGPTSGGSPTPLVDQNYLASQYIGTGDQTMATQAAAFGEEELGGRIVTGVDVFTPNDGAIVAIGDSITEGTQAASPWSRVLNRRLASQERKGGPRLGVINMGIAGNAVLSDGLGEALVRRFKNDALNQTGVVDVVMMAGINDMGVTKALDLPSIAELAHAFRKMGVMADRAGVDLHLSPLTPAGDTTRPSMAGGTPEQVALRRGLNDWIRSSRFYDRGIDFDVPLRNALDPDWLRFDADWGDGLHPNALGHQLMGKSLALRAFSNAVSAKCR